MRKIALAGLVALALSALAVAATWQTRRDDTASARTLLRGWRSIGGALVGPRLVGVATDTGLICFRYQVTKRLDRVVLCFAADGRLVELLRETHSRVTLVSVSTDADRAPIRLPVGAIEHASGLADEVQTLDSSLAALRKGLDLCGSAVDEAQKLGHRSPTFTAWLTELVGRCGDAATAGQVVAADTGRFARLSPLAVQLAALCQAMKTSAQSYLGGERAAVPTLARELGLRKRALTTLAAFARETGVDRRRLTRG